MSDQDVRELVARVGKLERDNRRWKLASGAVVAVLLAVALVGAVMPQEIPEIIEARAFHVTDENGELRALMNTNGIAYLDAQQRRSQMNTYGISYLDENGQVRSEMGADGIFYLDENGKTRGLMNADGIFYWDAEGGIIWLAPR